MAETLPAALQQGENSQRYGDNTATTTAVEPRHSHPGSWLGAPSRLFLILSSPLFYSPSCAAMPAWKTRRRLVSLSRVSRRTRQRRRERAAWRYHLKSCPKFTSSACSTHAHSCLFLLHFPLFFFFSFFGCIAGVPTRVHYKFTEEDPMHTNQQVISPAVALWNESWSCYCGLLLDADSDSRLTLRRTAPADVLVRFSCT